MISVGIDLAGKEKNQTGFCILKEKFAETWVLHTDKEIVEKVISTKPDIVAIDAPLICPPKIRKCDTMLKKYGAMPPTLPSMQKLSKRGYILTKKLGQFKVIEVFPTASAKILKIYDKDINMVRNGLEKIGLTIKNEICTKHETDSIIAALTGTLHLNGESEEVGNQDGIVVVPK